MKFRKFFGFDIRHEYYDGGPCDDLFLAPTAACARLLKSCRMLFQSGPGNQSVIAQVDENDKPLVTPGNDAAFDFYLFLENREFISYTSPLPASRSEIFLYTNRDNKGKSSLALVPVSIQKPQTSWTGSKSLFGMIRILPDASYPLTYSLAFKSAIIKWKYYLIANSNLTTLNIDGTAADIKFIKSKITAKTPADKIYDAILNNYPGAGLSIFESEKEVSLRQAGRKNIQLINTSNNVVLMDHLPNPGLKENGVKIINTLS